VPKYPLVILSALLLVGCSSSWERPDTSEAQLKQDQAQCQSADSRANHTERTCMQGLGYQQTRAGWMPF